MRVRCLFVTLFFAAAFFTGCRDTHDYADEEMAEEVRQALSEAEKSIRAAAEEARDAVREAMDGVDRNLDDAEDELGEARDRIRERRERIREELDEKENGFASALKSIGEAIELVGAALQNDSDIEPVDYRKLRDLLPREINGMKRISTDGSRKSALGIRISKIEAEYEGPRRDMSIAIIDLGSVSGAAAAGLDFFDPEFDGDYGDGYKRSTEFEGYPAIVKVDNSGRYHHYEAVVMVAERFVVTIDADGRGLDENIIEDVLDEISLQRLERLAR